MHHLTKDELTRLLKMSHATNREHWLMILVAYLHGLRASEVIGLTASNIKSGYLTVQRLKGSLKTSQPLITHDSYWLDEKQALETLRDSVGYKFLFPYSRRWFNLLMEKYGEMAGIPRHKCHPHVLKHSIAMHSISIAGIENLRQYLGHKSIGSTGAYLKKTDDEASKAIGASIGG